MLKVKKVLNTSVVLVNDESHQDLIALGKGLGFGKKVGDEILQTQVERLFFPADSPQLNQYKAILEEASPVMIDLIQQVIVYAEKQLQTELNDNLSFLLLDHLKFAQERLEKEIKIQNKLYWEVQTYYPNEFKVGLYALKLLEENLALKFPKQEAANIAFHIINAQKNSNEEYDSMKVTKILTELMTIIRVQPEVRLDPQSISYQRLVTHLKYFVERLITKRQLVSDDMIMQEHVLNTYTKAATIALKLVEFIDVHYHEKVSGEELTYLIVHINRNI